MKTVKWITHRKFSCVMGKNQVLLDFNPIVNGLSLHGNFIIIHWNKCHQLYGIYDGGEDKYFTANADNISYSVIGKLIEVFPEVRVLPTAGILYENCKVKYGDKNRVTIYRGK